MKRWLITMLCCYLCFLAVRPCSADERSETAKLAKELGAKQEVMLSDGTRCDLLTDTLAIEVDWAKKWPEAIGQSLHYARLTKKRPGIILLYYAGDDRHVERCKPIAQQCGIALFVRHVTKEKTTVELRGGPSAEKPGGEELGLPTQPPPWIRMSDELAALRKEHEALRARVAKTENKTAEIVSWSQKLVGYLNGIPTPRPPVVELRPATPATSCPCQGTCPCFPAAR